MSCCSLGTALVDVYRAFTTMINDPQASRHPTAVFFHIIFKVLALLIYLIGTWIWDSFVGITVVVVLLLALDFWTVKNVTGRLLVGLRWWCEVKETGESVWMFESQSDSSNVSPFDHTVFWMGVYLQPVSWIILGLGALFRLSLKWEVVVIFAMVLSSANVYGYLKCAKGIVLLYNVTLD